MISYLASVSVSLRVELPWPVVSRRLISICAQRRGLTGLPMLCKLSLQPGTALHTASADILPPGMYASMVSMVTVS